MYGIGVNSPSDSGISYSKRPLSLNMVVIQLGSKFHDLLQPATVNTLSALERATGPTD
jgi:hypothetical protein